MREMLSTRSTAGSETLFAGIHKLLPGHQLVFENGRIHIRQYWDLPVERHDGLRGGRKRDRDVVAEFRSLLEDSVRLRLMSDGPPGMFLSGGIDSSAIAASMARQIDRPLQTCSVAFKESAFNELA